MLVNLLSKLLYFIGDNHKLHPLSSFLLSLPKPCNVSEIVEKIVSSCEEKEQNLLRYIVQTLFNTVLNIYNIVFYKHHRKNK